MRGMGGHPQLLSPNADNKEDRGINATGIPMDMNNLLLSMLFGTCGTGYIMYGKKAGQLIPVAAGLLLVICPYFITSALAMFIVCGAIMSVPFVLRHA